MTIMQTDRLALPLLAAGQAQKELVHNEGIAEAGPGDTVRRGNCGPQCAAGARRNWPMLDRRGRPRVGDWAEQDGAIAGWTDNGWRFVMPAPGWRAWVIGSRAMRCGMMAPAGSMKRCAATAISWQAKGSRWDGRAAIANPTGGATVDSEIRADRSQPYLLRCGRMA